MKRIIDDEFLTMLEQRDLLVEHSMNGLFGGERPVKKYGSSLDFADYREYIPGDDLRMIDLHLYERFEKLYLKLFNDERQMYHRIYIDASSSMDWGEPPKSEIAIKLAAAFAYLSVRSNDRVAISVIRRDKMQPLCPPFSGTESFYRAADLLNRIKFGGEADFGRALLAEEEPGRDDGISIVLSDFFTDTYKEAVDRLVFRGRKLHLIQILSPEELMPDMRGKNFLRDSEAMGDDDERNYKLTVSRQRIHAYKKAMEFHQNEMKDYCKNKDVGFFTVLTDTAIEQVLFSQAVEERLIV